MTHLIEFSSSLWREIRFSIRALSRKPAINVFLILIIGLGVGSFMTIEQVIRSISQESLPVSQPSNLILLRWTAQPRLPSSLGQFVFDYPGRAPTEGSQTSWSFPQSALSTFRFSRSLSDVWAFAPVGKAWYGTNQVSVEIDGKTSLAAGMMVSGHYFSGLGVRPALGSLIDPVDQVHQTTVAVISSEYWQRHFAGSRSVLGKTLVVEGIPYTITGVASRGFKGAVDGFSTDFWIPLSDHPGLTYWGIPISQMKNPMTWGLSIMGRLRPGISRPTAEAELQQLFHQAFATGGDHSVTIRLDIEPGDAGIPVVRTALFYPLSVLAICAGIILILTCVNVSAIILERAVPRKRQVAIRLALGARFETICWQLLAEGLLLTLSGVAVGLLFSIWGSRILESQLSWILKAIGLAAPQLHVGFGSVVIAAVITALASVLFTIGPIIVMRRTDIASEVKDLSSAQSAGRPLGLTLGRLVLPLQIAVSLWLLIGAGLFVRTVEGLLHQDFGFSTANLYVFDITATKPDVMSPEVERSLLALQNRAQRIPGVESATFSLLVPLSGRGAMLPVSTEKGAGGTQEQLSLHVNIVAPDFVKTMKIPLLSGRDITESDTAHSTKVIVLDDFAAQKLFGTQPAVGQVVRESGTGLFVAGVVANSDYESPYESLLQQPPPVAFLPYTQVSFHGFDTAYLEVRSRGSISAVASGIRKASSDFGLIVGRVTSEHDIIRETISKEEFFAQFGAFVSVVALLFAVIGLSGTFLCYVSQRHKDISIRLALGAPRRNIIWYIFKRITPLIVVGIGLGLWAGYYLGGQIGELYYGVQPLNFSLAVYTIAVVVLCSAISGFIPAWHACSVDPASIMHVR